LQAAARDSRTQYVDIFAIGLAYALHCLLFGRVFKAPVDAALYWIDNNGGLTYVLLSP